MAINKLKNTSVDANIKKNVKKTSLKKDTKKNSGKEISNKENIKKNSNKKNSTKKTIKEDSPKKKSMKKIIKEDSPKKNSTEKIIRENSSEKSKKKITQKEKDVLLKISQDKLIFGKSNDYDEKYDEEQIEYFNNKKKSKLANNFPSIKILRAEILKKIDKFIDNKEISKQIEKGIIKYVNKTCTKQICYEAIYRSKSTMLISNMNPESSIGNTKFVYRILNNKLRYNQKKIIDYEVLAFMKPQEIFPERWEKEIHKKKIRIDKMTNIATTDAFPCPVCRARKARTSAPAQIRSADEPMTCWIDCVECKHTWRIMC